MHGADHHRRGSVGKSRRIAPCVILAATLALPPAHALAAGTCRVSLSGGLQLGGYDPFGRGHRDGLAQLRVDCPPGVSVQVAIGKGNSATYAARELRGPDGVLRYNLFLDPGHRIVWGDGTEGTQVLQATGSTTAVIYARIPAGQDVASGAYSDDLVITVFL